MRRYRFRIKLILLVSTFVISAVTLRHYSSSTPNIKPKLDRDYVVHQGYQRFEKKQAFSIANIKKDLDGGRVQRINIFNYGRESVGQHKHTQNTADLMTWNGNTTIFIHNPEIDMISSYIKDYGTWEMEFLQQIGTLFQSHRHMQFLDIGCNIGVYTLFVAKLGTRVVAIDAVKDNLRLLSKSLQVGNLSDRVMLVWNAISDSHQNVSLLIPNGNIGGAHIIDNADASNTATRLHNVETIVLDDLVDIMDVRYKKLKRRTKDKVFMKLDIEGNEDKALAGGRTFFQTLNVIGIFMEWMHHRYTSSGQTIVDILVKEGFLPYDTANMSHFLNPDVYYRWPENVFWMKR